MTNDNLTPVVKAIDIAYARMTAPDLDLMEEFLLGLGMVRSARTDTALYMRGTDPTHHLHVTELGEPRFLGLAFAVASEADLERLAQLPEAEEIHDIPGPGGGRRVFLTDPNGYRIEAVHGISTLAPIDIPAVASNSSKEPELRLGRGPWGPDTPPHIKRFGHAVIKTQKFDETLAWYQRTFGLRISDEFVAPSGSVFAAFNRFDRGDAFVDHHSLLVLKAPHAGWHHVSYEVQSWSEVFSGAANLAKDARFKCFSRPSRHLVGGQVGSYFADPWGRLHEFWSDGDRLNASHEPKQWTIAQVMQGPKWDPNEDPEFGQQIAT